MIAVVDNYDSFTFNLVQALAGLGEQVRVFPHDAIDVPRLRGLAPRAVVLSPGPGRPAEAGVTPQVIRELAGEVPLLGVCLGHQALCEVYGARVVHAPRMMHGVTSAVYHGGRGILRGLPDPFDAARYHSLIVDPGSLPAQLQPTAWTDRGELMAVQHRSLPVYGVQFHPESFMTPQGVALLANFTALSRPVAVREPARV